MKPTRHRRLAAVAVLVAFVLAVGGCAQSQGEDVAATAAASTGSGGESSSTSPSEPVQGGTIKLAISGDPQTFDTCLGGRTLTLYVGQQIFEGLFAVDATFQPHAMLAESYEVSPDRLTYTIALREGVVFHDGSAFDSGDAVASIERWMAVSDTGTRVAADIASVDAPDPGRVVITLRKARYSLISDLAWSVQAAIMVPEEIAEAAGTNPMTTEQIIGTGPYKLGTYTPGQSVTLERFDGYQPVAEVSDGYAGAKQANADTLEYLFVSDAQQRLNGLRTGQWHWVSDLSVDDLDSAKTDPAITVTTTANGYFNALLLNENESAAFKDVKARQALNLLLNKQEIAVASLGPTWRWEPLSGALGGTANAAMYSTAGEEVFGTYDPERAKTLFAEAGVDGSKPIKIVSTQTYPQFYQWAVIVQAELEEIGLKADIEVYDYPTADEIVHTQPEAWDLSMTFFQNAVASPGQILWLSPEWPGEYRNPAMDRLVADWQLSNTPEEAHAIVEQVTALVYEDFPVLPLGNVHGVGVFSASLQHDNPLPDPMWNTWVVE